MQKEQKATTDGDRKDVPQSEYDAASAALGTLLTSIGLPDRMHGSVTRISFKRTLVSADTGGQIRDEFHITPGDNNYYLSLGRWVSTKTEGRGGIAKVIVNKSGLKLGDSSGGASFRDFIAGISAPEGAEVEITFKVSPPVE